MQHTISGTCTFVSKPLSSPICIASISSIMQANPFLSLAVVQLPPNARILPSSWCPDKDLLLVITRQRSKDRISLYRMQGTKVWEVEFDADTPDELEIVDIAWSPDCE